MPAFSRVKPMGILAIWFIARLEIDDTGLGRPRLAKLGSWPDDDEAASLLRWDRAR